MRPGAPSTLDGRGAGPAPVTGFRFDVAAPGPVSPALVELDGIPAIGHRLRVTLNGRLVDLPITAITWFHAPGALSKSGLLTLGDFQP